MNFADRSGVSGGWRSNFVSFSSGIWMKCTYVRTMSMIKCYCSVDSWGSSSLAFVELSAK